MPRAFVHKRVFREERPSPARPKALATALLFCLGLLIPLSSSGAYDDSASDGRKAPPAELQVWAEGKQPFFTLDSLEGGSKSLRAQAGRVVLVHFFATWCEPCREEISSLARMSGRSTARPLVFAVDVGEVDIRVRRFFEKLPVDFPVLLDRDKAGAKSWGVDQLPTTFLLDTTLTPRFVVVGDFDWDRADIDGILAVLSAAHGRKARAERRITSTPENGAIR